MKWIEERIQSREMREVDSYKVHAAPVKGYPSTVNDYGLRYKRGEEKRMTSPLTSKANRLSSMMKEDLKRSRGNIC